MSIEVIFIAGPTAVGKTYFAEEISDIINGELISCDSRTIYKGLDIGTGKSSNSSSLRYHMIDLIEPGEILPIYHLVMMTRDLIVDIYERGSIPIICGGSHHWMERIIDGMVGTPPPDPEQRKYFRNIEIEKGKGSLHRILHENDPELASKVHPNNISKILRYLEISNNNDPVTKVPPLKKDFKIFFLDRSIGTLRTRIRKRAISMIENGWVEEVKELIKIGIGTEDPGMDSTGYNRIFDLSQDKIDIHQCIDSICSDTVKVARSQRKWRKRFDNTIRIDLDNLSIDEVTRKMMDIIK